MLGQVTNDALGIGTLGHLFDEGGLDGVAKLGLDRLAALVMSEGPAGIANRADVNPGRLQRFGLGRGRRCLGLFFLAAADQNRGSDGAQGRQFQDGALGHKGHVYSFWV